MSTPVATVVALRRGRLLTVLERGLVALPGGKVESGESARDAAARELREEVGIELEPACLIDLELRIAAGAAELLPFAAFDPPPAATTGELPGRWVVLSSLARQPLVPGVARSVHAALARAGRGTPRAAVARLLEWWQRERAAELPWRATRDPYAVLVCEVMSQQTQIDRVSARWRRWLERWPTTEALAAASLGEVLREWDGLGYPRRARDLHAAAARIAARGWPAPERLTELPGVGEYTAAAIRCFALEQPLLPRDANVRRVLARRFPGGLPGSGDAWALGGALMDLGRTHCRARPRCAGCPLRAGCMVALADGWDPAPRARRQAAYAGSLRQRRGALLRAALNGQRPRTSLDPEAAASLLADGLVAVLDGALAPPRSIVGAAP